MTPIMASITIVIRYWSRNVGGGSLMKTMTMSQLVRFKLSLTVKLTLATPSLGKVSSTTIP